VRTTGNDRRPPLRGEDLLLTVLCSAVGPLLWWFGVGGLSEEAGTGGLQFVERMVASTCAGAGAVVALGWFIALAGTGLAVLGYRIRSARLARIGRVLSPAFLRRVAASVLGVNLLLASGAWADGPGGTATAPQPTSQDHGAVLAAPPASHATPSATMKLPHPGWLTPAPAGPPTPSLRPVPLPAERAAHRTAASSSDAANRALPAPTWKPSSPAPGVPGAARAGQGTADETRSATVRRGDCLWDIAAEELGPYATDLEIDRRWRQWHQHNHTTIGEDASVLIPGTVLKAPPLG
jgi:hypothetical protein